MPRFRIVIAAASAKGAGCLAPYYSLGTASVRGES